MMKEATEQKLTLRLPGPLHQQLVASAKRERRSLNAHIIWLAEQHVKEAA